MARSADTNRPTVADVLDRGQLRFKLTTDSHQDLPIDPDLFDRQFTVTEFDKVWVGDITSIQTDEGWLFLAADYDLFNLQVVGWSCAPTRRATS